MEMGLFGTKMCKLCGKNPQTGIVRVASGTVVAVCGKCKSAMGGKRRPR